MKKGETYSFQIHLYDSDACRTVYQETWAHENRPVESGPGTCVDYPWFYDGGVNWTWLGASRMWHQQGLNDSSFRCQNLEFDASLPTGWLATYSFNGNDRYVQTMTDAPGFPAQDCPQQIQARGAQKTYWRETPNYLGATDHACLWPQFLPPGETSASDWFYGLPWRTSTGGTPRDIYVEMSSVDLGSMLATNLPEYRYNEDENFLQQSANALVEHEEPGSYPPGAALYDGADPSWPIAAAGATGPPGLQPLTLAMLGTSYSFGGTADGADWIDAPGNTEAEYIDDSFEEITNGNGLHTYGHVVEDGQYIWLQYWAFHYDNPTNFTDIGAHEGDWEMVQVGLNDALQPAVMTFAQHADGHQDACDWSDVEKVNGTHPVVYVAKGTHASYPHPGDDSTYPTFVDDHWGNGTIVSGVPFTVLTDNSPNWIGWPGRWGGSDDSPSGPAQGGNADRWNHPTSFHAGGEDDCDSVL